MWKARPRTLALTPQSLEHPQPWFVLATRDTIRAAVPSGAFCVLHVVFINVPFGGGPFFGIHCDEGTRLETGKVELGILSPKACPDIARAWQ